MTRVRVGGPEPPSLAPPDLPHGLVGRDRLSGSARLADPRLDPPLAQRPFELAGGVAAVGPQLSGADAAPDQGVEQRQQVTPLVLVAGGETDGERSAGGVDG